MNNPIFDIHCHPSLKVYLCDADFTISHKPANDFVPGAMHYDLPGMQEGGVQVIFSYQYVPEEGLGEMHKIAWLYKLLDGLGVKYAERFEQRGETTEVFTKTMNGIN